MAKKGVPAQVVYTLRACKSLMRFCLCVLNGIQDPESPTDTSKSQNAVQAPAYFERETMAARASKLGFHPKSMFSRVGDIVFEGFHYDSARKFVENFKIDKNSTSFITDFIERGLLQQCVIPECKLNKEAATDALKKHFIKPSGLVVSTCDWRNLFADLVGANVDLYLLRSEANLIVQRYKHGNFTRFVPCGPEETPYSAVTLETSSETGAPEETINKLRSKGIDLYKKTPQCKKPPQLPSPDNDFSINTSQEVPETTKSKTTLLLPNSKDDTVLTRTDSLIDDEDAQIVPGNGKVSVATQTAEDSLEYEAIIVVTSDAEVQTETIDDTNNDIKVAANAPFNNSLKAEDVQLLIDLHKGCNKGSKPTRAVRNSGICLPLDRAFVTKSRFFKEANCETNKRTRSLSEDICTSSKKLARQS
jgi:hypothetical protein